MQQSVVEVVHGPDGRPLRAAAVARLQHPADEVWRVIADVERYPGRVPMIHRVRRQGDELQMELKFKVAIVSVGFQVTTRMKAEPPRSLTLTWVSGEPRDLVLRFDLEPLDDGRACRVRAEGAFDPRSLGWLTKFFLKHHPEIEYGIFPGVAIALVDSMRRAVEAER